MLKKSAAGTATAYFPAR
ncbi:MAG TPA: hypothetical protein DIV41_05245 [Ruminococcaceae bacterium]|nr:hypothetical protein [Oscillospiraceae bacterium]